MTTPDVSFTGSSHASYPNCVGDPFAGATSDSATYTTTGFFINPAAFAQPALGTLGNSGRSSIPGPGFWEIDTALSRIFRVREGRTVELRAEAFNLTNSFRAGSPGMPTVTTARNSPQFGQILTAQDPRIMQLAMKFVF